MKNFIVDRPFIENKYHKTNEEFNPYQRMTYHGYDFDETTGKTDEEILDGLSKESKAFERLPHPIAKAKAVSYVLENTKIDISEHDYFVGFYSLNRLANSVTSNIWNKEIFNKLKNTNSQMNILNSSGAISIWPDFDHVVPNWDDILTLGFKGLKQRAQQYKEFHQKNGTLNEEMSAHFDGIEIEYSAIINVIDRLYNYALKKKSNKSEKIAKCLLNIRDNPPKTLYEALQVIYIYFIISECFDSYQVRSLGNGLDNTLYKFYKSDLENGTSNKDDIKELFAYFFIQWSAIGNYWGQPFYMGGTDKNGNTKYNELSYLILDVYDEIDIYNPKIQIKVNYNTPDKLLNKVFDMIRRGHSCFCFCCEPGLTKAVMSYGATLEEASDIDIRGCYETGVRSNEVSSTTGYINAVKAVEYVFSNGFDKNTNTQIGVTTGDITNFKTFEDFYSAVLKQWSNLIETSIKLSDSYEKYFSFINPSIMYSATIKGSLEKGLDAYQNGVKFNNSSVLNCGFATLVDSLMAVKELVYDTKYISLKEYKNALDNNWNGYEKLHIKALHCKHKYGNNDYETDIYSNALASFFAFKINNRPNARGGVYKALMHSAMQFCWQGEKTLASPDGRTNGAENSKNASPSIGMDKNGVTSLINSVIKIKPCSYPEGFCLDIMLHSSAAAGDEGLTAMKALLFTYLKNNGMTMQFNIFDTKTLKDAQKNPEKYKNLQVRVCGWNALFNNLSKEEQNSYIKRSENIM